MYLGVIAEPGKQSLSPVFQQAALDHLKLGHVYQLWPTPPDGLATRVKGLRAPTVLGANVTIPHKEAILPLLDETDDLSRRTGAVNTVLNNGGRLHGHNTDVAGFLRALREEARFDPWGKRAVIAGAGGAARAVAVALIDAEAASVTIVNRSLDRARRLVNDLRRTAGRTALDALPAEPEAWQSAARSCDLLVNCTSVGTAGTPEEKESPVPLDLLHREMLVYDLVYRPATTMLMAAARERGAATIGGLPMLIYQGAESFRIWTGQEAPVDVMFAAAREALAAEGEVA
jgi:shikimate dehydrogenase